ncbi:NADH-quinone oxidoreductase subunit K [Bosea sp. (in: a-proteobacteria)]|uniref:NADH-quinone oxidoreductase subunit K n=1 Tax=Bosea sp. (in: a-proteobacteria) TaxID=1871050 RepID=UPI00260AAAC8|nr:NADH-quinone oxidoreductase subunit K [Bosea sp. (in: a-proteobacteria)]MCO5091059.1 NADH-quinone oxidoreductase subunit K [Bosea sp. (in: a-proteobacteria)]
MTALLQPAILFGLTGAALVGIGLFAVVTQPGLLRRIVGCNILGAGIFLVFGAVARRGAGAGFEADPVPQALVITGIVVAFSASALAIALLKRLSEITIGEGADAGGPEGGA